MTAGEAILVKLRELAYIMTRGLEGIKKLDRFLHGIPVTYRNKL